MKQPPREVAEHIADVFNNILDAKCGIDMEIVTSGDIQKAYESFRLGCDPDIRISRCLLQFVVYLGGMGDHYILSFEDPSEEDILYHIASIGELGVETYEKNIERVKKWWSSKLKTKNRERLLDI